MPPRLPGLNWEYRSDIQAPWFPTTSGDLHLNPFDPEKDVARPSTDGFAGFHFGGGVMNILKLHGSYNWRTTSAGDEVMVLGGAKDVAIAKYPILSFYFDVFEPCAGALACGS
jgi:hypothetical protein